MTNKEMKILDKCIDTISIISNKVEVMFKAIEAIQKYIINKERNMAYVDENEQFDKDALLHKLQSEVDMNVGLTDRQKELFQEDKHMLVDTIIALETELEIERQARCAAEGAHIRAQEEIDGKVKPIKLKDDTGFNENVLRAIGKYHESEMAKDAKEIKEEGENGQL